MTFILSTSCFVLPNISTAVLMIIRFHDFFGTQDEEKQNKNTTQYVLDTTIRKQTETM
jgi:hypothetical protein